jgi:hypothetical protein
MEEENWESTRNFRKGLRTTDCAIWGLRISIGQHAECFLQQGKGLVKVNGQPLSLVQPEILRFKVRTLAPSTPTRQKEKRDSQRIAHKPTNGNGEFLNQF